MQDQVVALEHRAHHVLAVQGGLVRRRYVVEIRVLEQRIEAVVADRAVRVADDCLGEATVVESALRALALGVVHLAEQPACVVHLVLEAVAEQPEANGCLVSRLLLSDESSPAS